MECDKKNLSRHRGDRLDSQVAPDALLQPFDVPDAVLDLGLHEDARDVGEDFLGELLGIAGFDQAFGGEVADEHLEVFEGAYGHLLGLLADFFVLRAQFTADRAEGATEHLAEALVLLLLIRDIELAIFLK